MCGGVGLCRGGLCGWKGERKREVVVSMRNSEIYVEIVFVIIMYVGIGNKKGMEDRGGSLGIGKLIKDDGRGMEVDKIRDIGVSNCKDVWVRVGIVKNKGGLLWVGEGEGEGSCVG